MDGGFIVVGETSSNNGDVTGNMGVLTAGFVKLGETGDVQWQHAYGGTGDD